MKQTLTFVLLVLCIIQIYSDNASKVVSFAQSKLGCGYVWGGEGQVLTQDRLNAFAKKYPTHVDRNIVKKWLGKSVYDCSGLVQAAFKTVGIKLIHNAQNAWKNTNWAKTGPISSYPKDKVCILYKLSNGKMTHTGIYIKNGEFIHAKGSKEGVVKEKMKGSWTHWGIPKGLY